MLISPSSVYADALADRYLIGAFNVFNLDMAACVLKAAELEKSPVILQISMGTRKYQGDWPLFVSALRLYAERADAPVFLQHDHCATVQACREAVDAGVMAVMFDGSGLPYPGKQIGRRDAEIYSQPYRHEAA